MTALDGVLVRLASDPRRAAAMAAAISVLYGVALAVFKVLPVNDALVFVALLAAIVMTLDRCDGRRRTLALHAVTQLIVLGWVYHLWTLGYEGRNAVFGGILPWSDSFDFLNDALRLIHGHSLEMAAKRPLFPVALAGLMRATGDLHLVLLLFAGFGAFAVALATDAVWRTHGSRAALIVFALLLFSERQWAGFVQTEHVGLPLGLIGFTLIWRAAAAGPTGPARKRALAGLFAVTIALMARAGAFFILPALALWSTFHLVPAEAGGKARWRHLAAAVAAIAAGGAVHEIVLHLAASGASFSDYPAIAFGLIHHRDFTLLAELHPELNRLQGAMRAATAWNIVIADALAHPLLVISGLARSFAELFYTPNGLFGFVWRNPDDMVLENSAAVRAAIAHDGLVGPLVLWVEARGLYSLCNAVAMALLAVTFAIAAIAALVSLYRRPADRFGALLRWAMGGVLLSAPFTPPWITSSHQVEVATLAFLAATVARWRAGEGRDAGLGSPALVWLPAAFAATVVGFAAVLTAWPQAAPVQRPVRLYQSAVVRVTAARNLNLTDRRVDDLAFSLPYLAKHNAVLVRSLAPYLKPGTRYQLAYDAAAGGARILVDDRGLLDGRGGWVALSGTPQAEPRVLHVDAVRP